MKLRILVLLTFLTSSAFAEKKLWCEKEHSISTLCVRKEAKGFYLVVFAYGMTGVDQYAAEKVIPFMLDVLESEGYLRGLWDIVTVNNNFGNPPQYGGISGMYSYKFEFLIQMVRR